MKKGASMKLKICPSCGQIPYVAKWCEGSRNLNTLVAQVKCACGWSGPERYGPESEKWAVLAWNKRSKHE